MGSSPMSGIIRDVAQLVGRVIWDHEVAGSNPVIPVYFRPSRGHIVEALEADMDLFRASPLSVYNLPV